MNYDAQEELIGWSSSNPGLYLTISRENFFSPSSFGGKLIVRDMSAGNAEVSSFDLPGFFFPHFVNTYSSENGIAIIGYVNEAGMRGYLLFGFASKSWATLSENVFLVARGLWSTGDRWTMFSRYEDGIFVFDFNNPNSLVIVRATQYANPMGWIPGAGRLVYELNGQLYGVDPPDFNHPTFPDIIPTHKIRFYPNKAAE